MSNSDSQHLRRPERKSTAEVLKVWGPLLLLVALGFGIAIAKLEPPPPRSFKIAAGSPGGAYHAYAERYRAVLAGEGFELQVVETIGAIENYQLISSGEVELALLQGGARPEPVAEANDAGSEQINSLASVFYEPIWLFYRADQQVEELTDLARRRVAIGASGSGTQMLARQLLDANGIGAAEAELLPLNAIEAAEAVEQASVDAAFFVTSASASFIPRLVGRDDVELLSVRRSLAYRKAHPFLARVVLGEGVLDLERNLPDEDVSLLATAASLVARRDFHHALVPLLLRAMEEVHGGVGQFTAAGTFPSDRYLDYPLTAEARHYLENGPSFLHRYLGYRAATAIDRLKILLLPILTLLIPVFRFGPSIYRWRIRSRIYRWYEDLSWADEILHEHPTDEEIVVHLQALRQLEHEVVQVSVPLSYMDEYYSLRMHIQLILDKLERLTAERGVEVDD